MTRRRWIADEVHDNRAILVGAHAGHLTRVLRAHVGQEFDIVANGVLRRGKISDLQENRVEFDLGDEIPAVNLPSFTIALSIFKFDRMEWAIEKCTEIGVSRIVPLIAHRTEAHLASAAEKRTERWKRIARQAAEQSRRVSPPEIDQPKKLKDIVHHNSTLRILLDETESSVALKSVLQDYPSGEEVTLAIGPEGGWTQKELDQFHEAGWISASLGSTILRAETAAIAATAIVLSEIVGI
ncbi:MAG TPA: RsmE family RNA methyltransferase [Terriglobales bacterium]|jgi:16S rRNA (uracil1498-N3)-methyltransferase